MAAAALVELVRVELEDDEVAPGLRRFWLTNGIVSDWLVDELDELDREEDDWAEVELDRAVLLGSGRHADQ